METHFLFVGERTEKRSKQNRVKRISHGALHLGTYFCIRCLIRS